jgi:hypothetical protein
MAAHRATRGGLCCWQPRCAVSGAGTVRQVSERHRKLPSLARDPRYVVKELASGPRRSVGVILGNDPAWPKPTLDADQETQSLHEEIGTKNHAPPRQPPMKQSTIVVRDEGTEPAGGVRAECQHADEVDRYRHYDERQDDPRDQEPQLATQARMASQASGEPVRWFDSAGVSCLIHISIPSSGSPHCPGPGGIRQPSCARAWI